MFTLWQEKVRPLLDKRPGIVLGVIGFAAIASAVFGIRSWTNGGPSIADFSSYYTCDDGKTLFKDDDLHDIPPFQHDGREAVRAYIVPGHAPRTDSIWYLAKWSGEGKKRMEELIDKNMAAPAPAPVPVGKPASPSSGVLVKRPGDVEWIPLDDAKAGTILKLPE